MRIVTTLRKITRRRSVSRAVRTSVPRTSDLPIAGYDDLPAEAVAERLTSATQEELRAIEAYERGHRDRSAIVNRITALTENEPWSGYDRDTTEIIAATLDQQDLPAARRVKLYERAHKARPAVLHSATRRIARP